MNKKENHKNVSNSNLLSSKNKSLYVDLEIQKDRANLHSREISRQNRGHNSSISSYKSNENIKNTIRILDRSGTSYEKLDNTKILINLNSLSIGNMSSIKHDQTQTEDSLECVYNQEGLENELHYLRDLRNNLAKNEKNLQESFKAYEVKNQKKSGKTQISTQNLREQQSNNKKDNDSQYIEEKHLLNKSTIHKSSHVKIMNTFEMNSVESFLNVSGNFSKSVKNSRGNNFNGVMINGKNASYDVNMMMSNKNKKETKNFIIKKIDLDIEKKEHLMTTSKDNSTIKSNTIRTER